MPCRWATIWPAPGILDLIADQTEAGMEVVGSGQEYVISANWKLLAENSIDGFHGFPMHATYFDYLKTMGGCAWSRPARSASGKTTWATATP